MSEKRLAILVLVVLLWAPAALARADAYRVEFAKGRADDDGLYRRARVEATITPVDGVFGFFRNRDDAGFPQGWATFVERLEAFDASGAPMPVRYVGEGRWRAEGWGEGPLTVRYVVLLQHDRFPIRIGDGETAWARPWGVSWTGRALFVEGAPAADIGVEFVLPPDWRATTPWLPAAGRANAFLARTTDDLLDAAFVAGTHRETVVPIAGFEARLAIVPDAPGVEAAFRSGFDAYLRAYADLFGPESNSASPLIIAADAGYWSAGVMGRSISLLMGGPLTDETAPLLDHVVAHEGFHLWNARWFGGDGAPDDLEWLAEGSAEYYALLSGLRSGRLQRDAFLAELSRRAGVYLTRIETGAIADAGVLKGADPAAYDRVYTGGMMLLLALDLELREESKGRASLDDLMRDIHRLHADQPGAGLTSAGLVALLDARGLDGAAFLDRHVRGREPLPLASLLDRLGVDAAMDRAPEGVTARLDFRSSPTRAQRRAWSALARR